MAAQRFQASTNPTLSEHHVGISNIFERELLDDTGIVASFMSAQLTIYDPDTDAIRREIVRAGQAITIGLDRYRVVSVEEGTDAPGWVSLERIE